MIESVNNEKIKEISKLNDKKYRYQLGLFLAPGKHLVEEALKKNVVKEIFILDGVDVNYGVKTTIVSENVMKKIVGLDNAPKEVAVCYLSTQNKIEGNVVILDDIRDPGNLGTIIRSAVAFNYKTLILSKNTVDIFNPKVVRATEGMLFNINIIVDDLKTSILDLKNAGYLIFATDVEDGASPSPVKGAHAIVIGSEANGLKEDLKKLCNNKLKIEMNPLCESLNAGVSASILMYQLGGKK